jgi:hypothetical protein
MKMFFKNLNTKWSTDKSGVDKTLLCNLCLIGYILQIV